MTRSAIQTVSRERDLLTIVYEAFNRRDIDSILNVMHPEVEWPNGMEGGWVHGREGVRAYWSRQWGMIDPRVDPVQFHEGENGKVVVDVHQVVRDLSGTVLLDRTVQHAYLIKGGLIVRMEIRET
jgi:ketosteroid isomerase-like protein